MLCLLGDIGATNARFALWSEDQGIHDTRILACGDYPSLTDALNHWLEAYPPQNRPTLAALCIAAPVTGDRISMTNHGWDFSIAETKAFFGWHAFHVVNDFSAVALSLPHLAPEDCHIINKGPPKIKGPMAVLGAGTGLGVSGLIPAGDGWIPLSGEGGHVTLAPRNDLESALLALARAQSLHGHVSAEYFLCGSGLERLYSILAAYEGIPISSPPDAATISKTACAKTDPRAVATVALFCSFLGNVAGNLALSLGSTGGVWLAGGILPRWHGHIDWAPLYEAFVDKGRFRSYLAQMPLHLITHPFPAFTGLLSLLR